MAAGLLAVSTPDGWVRLLEADRSERLSVMAHAKPVTCIAMSKDGSALATGSEDRAWKLFDALSGAEWVWGRGHDSLGEFPHSSSSAFASCWWAGGGGWGGVCCPLESKQASLTAYPPTPSEDASLNVSMHVGSSVSIGVSRVDVLGCCYKYVNF